MASLQNRSGSYKLTFCYRGKRHYLTLGRVSDQEAEAKSSQVDYLLLRIKQKLVRVPAGVAIEDFVLNDGRVPEPHEALSAKHGLGQLVKRYLETHGNGSFESSSLKTAGVQLGHFERSLGEAFPVQTLSLADLQSHVETRSKQKYRGRRLSPATIKKEVAALRAAWNWAARMGMVKGPFPNHGLVYPKGEEKLPFMTRAEIERRLTGGGLTPKQVRELWDCLFLTLPEVAELLGFVRENALHPWVYPMVCFAAHTGARRSEAIRALAADVDFDAGTVMVREKKRVKGMRTTRRVPLSPFLAGVLRDWLKEHPGGPLLFAVSEEVGHSSKRSRTTGHQNGEGRPTSLKGRLASVRLRDRPGIIPLTRDEAHDHLGRTLRGSKWEVLRGWHVLRHSFASNCAARGIDQRLIDTWLGHQTEEMKKRYRHIIPSTEAEAIRSVFE
jgi:integrase